MSGQERFQIKFAVYAIFRHQDEVLLSLRQGTGWKDGWWSLVAGHVDGGEAAETAMIREVTEEAAVVPTEFTHAYTMHRIADDPSDEYLDLFFEVTEWNGNIANNEPEKCGELKWCKIDNLPEQTLAYVKRVLDEYPRGVTYGSMEKE